jgi:pyruvate dehydrogenase E2 component (dihydrolipoamide acetyltransferase)
LAIDDKPTIRRQLPLSLTFDHRAVTGAEAARFMTAMIEHLEQSHTDKEPHND